MKLGRHWIFIGSIVTAHLAVGPATAQETLIGGETSHGGYGELVIKVGPSLDGAGVYTGGRGAWVVNFDRSHAVHVGIAGYGLSTRHLLPDPGPNDPARHLAFGYGGLELGYVHRPDRLVHLSTGMLIGAGGAAPWERGYSWPNVPDPSFAFVLEPGVTAELNITAFARLNVGATYRWVSGLDSEGVSDSDVSGVNGILSIRFGRF